MKRNIGLLMLMVFGISLAFAAQKMLTQIRGGGLRAASITVALVTNTNDSGAGSLRQAILDANASPQVGTKLIEFDIPATDPNYNVGTGVWTISPTSVLPTITGSDIVIGGYTQVAAHGNTNTSGPEIFLSGSGIGPGADSGFQLSGSNNTIEGICIGNFSYSGIKIDGGAGTHIYNCYIGCDPTGTTAAANAEDGITLFNTSRVIIGYDDSTQRNVISGNTKTGIYLGGSGTASNSIIRYNYIGRKAATDAALANGFCGIEFGTGANNNTVEACVVAYNGSLGNPYGIKISSSTSGNKLTQNVIYSNFGAGINHDSSPIAPPTILAANELPPPEGFGIAVPTSSVSGTAEPNALIELFYVGTTSDATLRGDAHTYLGAVYAAASGTWEGTAYGASENNWITATAIDTSNNTSIFSFNAVVGPTLATTTTVSTTTSVTGTSTTTTTTTTTTAGSTSTTTGAATTTTAASQTVVATVDGTSNSATIYLQMQTTKSANFLLVAYDRGGNIIAQQELGSVNPGLSSFSVSKSTFNADIYTIRIIDKNSGQEVFR